MTAPALPPDIEDALSALADPVNYDAEKRATAALRAAIARALPPPVAPTVEAALAALDVEAVDRKDSGVTVYEIVGLDDVRAAHRAEVDAAVKAERDRNLDVLADFYSKTRAGRYASLSKEARQARLDVLTHAYSRMGGGMIHERADELDRVDPIDGIGG